MLPMEMPPAAVGSLHPSGSPQCPHHQLRVPKLVPLALPVPWPHPVRHIARPQHLSHASPWIRITEGAGWGQGAVAPDMSLSPGSRVPQLPWDALSIQRIPLQGNRDVWATCGMEWGKGGVIKIRLPPTPGSVCRSFSLGLMSWEGKTETFNKDFLKMKALFTENFFRNQSSVSFYFFFFFPPLNPPFSPLTTSFPTWPLFGWASSLHSPPLLLLFLTAWRRGQDKSRLPRG